MSSASERANGRASGPLLHSVFLAVIDHSEEVIIGDGVVIIYTKRNVGGARGKFELIENERKRIDKMDEQRWEWPTK